MTHDDGTMDVVVNGEPQKVPFKSIMVNGVSIAKPVVGDPPPGMAWLEYSYLESDIPHFMQIIDPPNLDL